MGEKECIEGEPSESQLVGKVVGATLPYLTVTINYCYY